MAKKKLKKKSVKRKPRKKKLDEAQWMVKVGVPAFEKLSKDGADHKVAVQGYMFPYVTADQGPVEARLQLRTIVHRMQTWLLGIGSGIDEHSAAVDAIATTVTELGKVRRALLKIGEADTADSDD